jgi:hypothetical protein
MLYYEGRVMRRIRFLVLVRLNYSLFPNCARRTLIWRHRSSSDESPLNDAKNALPSAAIAPYWAAIILQTRFR